MRNTQVAQVETKLRPEIHALAEETVKPASGGMLEFNIKLVIDALEVTCLETFKDHLVPDDPAGKGFAVYAHRAAIVQFDVIKYMKTFCGPRSLPIITPGVFVEQRNAQP